MILPTSAQLTAATQAARKAIEDYSEFDSSMVPDAALTTVVEAALIAAFNVQPEGKST